MGDNIQGREERPPQFLPYPPHQGIWSALYLFVSVLLALSVAAGELSFRWRGFEFSWSKSLAFQVWLVFSVIALLVSIRTRAKPIGGSYTDNYWMPLVGVVALILFMASSVRQFNWYFFLNPRAVLWVILLALPSIFILEFIERKNLGRLVYPLLLLAAQIYLLVALYQTTGGQPIYRDDHPSFLYRLWLMSQSFPRMFIYNPFWNGGYIGIELIHSGAFSLGWLALPFMAAFGLENIYTWFMAGVFFVLLPWISFLVVRSLGWSPLSAWMASFLTLGVHRFFFVNLLTYGTTPSLFISFLVVLVWAILYSVLSLGRMGWRRWLALVAALNLMIFWPASAIILLPVGLALLLNLHRLSRRSLLFLGSAALILAMLNGWWIYHYISEPGVIAFISSHVGQADGFSFHRAMRSLSSSLKQTNPLILVAGFLGLLWPSKKSDYTWLVPPALLFMFMIATGRQYKAHLQFHRMIIPLSFFLIIPASSLFNRCAIRKDLPSAIFRGVAAGAILLTILNVGGLLRNRGMETYWPMKDEIKGLAGWIPHNVPEEGRLFFAGKTLHGYGGGHVAYLQAATGRNMIAGDYYHFDPRLHDYNPVPVHFRGSSKKLLDYFELMGVTHIVTYRKDWIKRLSKKEPYQFEADFGKIKIYRTGIKPGFFLRGEGTVVPSINRLDITLDSIEEGVVLKFLWQEGLQADPPAILSPVEVAPGVSFIGVRPGEARRITIRYNH